MRVNLFQKIVIIYKLFLISFKDASRAAFVSMLVKDKEEYVFNVIHSWARNVLRIMRVRCKVFNPHSFEFNKEGKPYIIMSNHLSHFDIPLIYNLFPNDKIGMISKKEIFRIPIFGRGMRMGGCVSIDRENKKQAIKDLAYAKKTMLRGIRLWIAPEGTRSRTGEMGVFKKGGFKVAMETKATIVPITINYSNKILPTKTFDFSLDEEVEMHIGRPIDTAKYQATDIKRLMADTFNEIASKRRRLENE